VGNGGVAKFLSSVLVFPTITLKFAGVPLPVKYKKPHYMQIKGSSETEF